MSKPVGRIIGQWIGISASLALAGAGIVALRHALETPQPLKSALPGEAHLYRWRRRSIFYKVAGPLDAPALVLLHRPDLGISGHEMVHIMAPLAQTYRVYALDLLGFGLSDRPGIEYSAELYSALCQDFLREVVQRPATLMASGLSCNYAIAAAAHAPELCASLILISPVALQGEQQTSVFKRAVEKPPVKALLYPLLSTHLAFLFTRQDEREEGEDFAQFYASTHQLGAEHAAMARLAGKLAENREQEFETLQQPILMIWGTHALDKQEIVASLHRTATLANPARQIRKVELIQEAALIAHVEQPEAVIAVLQHWQEELHKGELASPVETPNFALLAVEEQQTRATALLGSLEQRTAPVPMQNKSASAVAQTSHSTPSQVDRTNATLEPDAAREEVQANNSASIAGGSATELENNSHEELEIMAYCVKCKQKRVMLHARQVTMKNGRPAMRGICPICGTRLNRIGGVN